MQPPAAVRSRRAKRPAKRVRYVGPPGSDKPASDSSATPPFEPDEFFGQVLFGGISGIALGVVFGLVGAAIGDIGGAVLGTGVAIAVFLLAPPLVSAIFYNLDRSYKAGHGPPPMALLNVRDGAVAVGVPLPYLAPNKAKARRTIRGVRLLDMTF